MAIPRSLVGPPIIGVLCLALSGCGDEAPSLTDVKRFESYRVYYAGGEVAGEPLVEALGDSSTNTRANAWVFIYGRCDADDFPEGEGGCYPPLQIHNYSVCTRRPDLSSARRVFDIRGAKVGEDFEGRLELSTGATTITVGARERKVALAPVRSLRTIRGARPRHFAPSIPGALEATLSCQHVPRKSLTADSV